MPQEIERKFLVRDGWQKGAGLGIVYHQGYLSLDPKRTVRVRTAGTKAYITVKGEKKGASGAEFEYPIPIAEATQMLGMCVGTVLCKTRHKVRYEGMLWEIDVFHGDNQGLTVAEIELPSESAAFMIPSWVTDEVTGDPRYYNSNLIQRPFCTWEKK